MTPLCNKSVQCIAVNVCYDNHTYTRTHTHTYNFLNYKCMIGLVSLHITYFAKIAHNIRMLI